MENTANSGKRGNVKKWLLGGLGVITLGTLTFFGIDYYSKNKTKKSVPAKPKVKAPVKKQAVKKQATNNPKKTVAPKPKAPVKPAPKKEPAKQEALKQQTSPQTPPKKEATFPLKKGDSGYLVKKLQEELIKQFGESILPKDKANGVFGKELENALTRLKTPLTNGKILVTETIYTNLVKPIVVSPDTKAYYLWFSISKKRFDFVKFWLSTIANKKEYSNVSTAFAKYLTNGVRQTLVNGTLSTFKEQSQQQQIRSEFLRMGLTYDGKKWSLSGIKNTPQIITTMATTVWKDSKTSVPVPVNMVLGVEITKRGDFTLFENDRQYFLVESKCVKLYNA